MNIASAGDVLAARSLADQLLASLPSGAGSASLARLILTAASLVVDAPAGPPPTLDDLLDLLGALDRRDADARLQFSESPMQIAMFVAAELEGLALQTGRAIALSIQAVRTAREAGRGGGAASRQACGPERPPTFPAAASASGSPFDQAPPPAKPAC